MRKRGWDRPVEFCVLARWALAPGLQGDAHELIEAAEGVLIVRWGASGGLASSEVR